MNKICKQYISDVKNLFPIIGKNEKRYIKGLETELHNYCIEENITDKKELCQKYGMPNEILNNYYRNVSIDDIIKKIRIMKYIKRLTATILILGMVITSIYIWHSYAEYRIAKDQEVVIYEDFIE